MIKTRLGFLFMDLVEVDDKLVEVVCSVRRGDMAS